MVSRGSLSTFRSSLIGRVYVATKLYVGNLPYKTTDSDLSSLFAQAGSVATATVISDKFSGRSKGFGFVEMSSDEEAQKAIEMLNGQEMEGRKIVVSEARPLQPRPPRQFGGGGNRGGRGRGDY